MSRLCREAEVRRLVRVAQDAMEAQLGSANANEYASACLMLVLTVIKASDHMGVDLAVYRPAIEYLYELLPPIPPAATQ